jgi:hypothetical protein
VVAVSDTRRPTATIKKSRQYRKAFMRLPEIIQQKARRQERRLARDHTHPGLQARKLQGQKNLWEARVDDRYRLTFERHGSVICLRDVGSHDIYP